MRAPRASNLLLSGRAISSGIVAGPAFLFVKRLGALAGAGEIPESQIEGELLRLERAMATVREDLQLSARRMEANTTTELGAIFEAHAAMLQDSGLRDEIQTLVKDEWINAAHALSRVCRRWERRFRKMKEASQQRYADDIADLRQRLLRELAGVKTTALEKIPTGRVLVARRLLPSDTIALPRRAVSGIVLEFGGSGSHAALLAEALGIPTVAQIPNVMEKIADGDLLIVDGLRGEVIVNPDRTNQKRYATQMRRARTRSTEITEAAKQPVFTRDGVAVAVLANVGGRDDVTAAAADGADGVGLYRLEQFYLAHKTPPSATDLLAELRSVFEPMPGKPITVRLLDLGGDKPLPFLKLPPEDNPFLGQRGVRFLLRFPDLLDTQLQALCAFSRECDLRILVPMVTLPGEMAIVRSRLHAAAGASKQKLPPLGAMIETPAAALCVDELARHSDFFSVGTNDLTQYTLAAGRENPLVNDYFLDDHPAVLRLIRITLEEAGGLPVSVCGELARQPNAIPKLLALGIRALSVAPPLVPSVKQCVRELDLSKTQPRA